MKKIPGIFLVCLALVSCTDQSNDKGEDSPQNKNTAKNISSRDYSINPSNSYSDLFLDSLSMEKFFSSKTMSDSIKNRIRSFYNSRNYQYAWFNSEGLTEEARNFWNLHDYATSYEKDSLLKDKSLKREMDFLTTEDTVEVRTGNKKILQTELTLTDHFIRYMLQYYDRGFLKRKEMERFIPRKKENVLILADSILTKKHKDEKYFENVNQPYSAMKEQLAKYYAIAKNGSWPVIPVPKKPLKKGKSSPSIKSIKLILRSTGDLAPNDSSEVFDVPLDSAIRSFQSTHGYKPTGIIGAELVRELNIPAVKRLEQILLNMDRMRWMIRASKGNLVMVNIPEFELHVYEHDRKVFDMDVVVGKEGHNTTVFNGDLDQVIFSPYWNLPASIVEQEILPALEKDPDYLEKQDMEMKGKDENGLPVIRQKPGGKNALGKVKFLFPNSFNIYFHDTPAKSLFNLDKRAYSHGCIRLKDPEKMAEYVLQDQPEWTPEKIDEAMNSGEEKSVRVKNPVPVVITYYTAWVDDAGRLNFRGDIYGHDSSVVEKRFH